MAADKSVINPDTGSIKTHLSPLTFAYSILQLAFTDLQQQFLWNLGSSFFGTAFSGL